MERDGSEQPTVLRPGGVRAGAAVAAEVLGVLAMLLGTAGTCALLIAAHARLGAPPPPPMVVAHAAPPAPEQPPAPVPEPVQPPEPEPVPVPVPEPEPIVPEVDATAEALALIEVERRALADRVEQVNARLSAIQGELEARADRVDEELAGAREAGRRRAVLAAEADRLEAELQLEALERDVLDRRRAEAEQRRQEAIARPGYAILPYRGPNGTWRRPIPVECRDGTATLEPDGLSFSMVELMALPGRPGPFGASVKRLAALVQAEGAPDGTPVEPYVLFVVRPDGIRPFYEARSALDANGVPYGYELVDQDWEIEYPSWDDPTIWESLEAARQHDPVASAGLADEPIASIGPAAARPTGGLGDFPLDPPSPAELVETMRDLDGALSGGLGGIDPGGGLGGPGTGFSEGLDSLDAEAVAGGVETDGLGGSIPILPEGSTGPGSGLTRGRSLGGQGMPATSGMPGRGPGDRIGGGGTGIGLRDGDPAMAPGGGLRGLLGGGGAGTAEGGRPPGGPLLAGLGDGPGRPASVASAVSTGPASSAGDIPSGADRMPGGAAPDPSGRLASPGPAGGPSRAGMASGATGGDGTARGEGDGGGGSSGRPGLGIGGAGRTVELVVVCGPKGVTIHPGGFKLAEEAVTRQDGRLVETLQRLLTSIRRREPSASSVPSVRFLVERGGYGLYWSAKSQMELAGLGWPISWQVAEPRTFSLFGSERW